MSDITKLDMHTPDLTQKNIKNIATLFPNVVTETIGEDGNPRQAIDFDLLKQQLSEDIVEWGDERYRLDRPGKKKSLLKANTPITKMLRPVPEDSVDWENTQNLYIEGDNFEVLKILQESYLGQVKMIYIDPPYNTGKDFVYTDKFKMSKDAYEWELDIIDEEWGRLVKNTDTNGRFHSDWLSMMYERLIVARDLLKDDGVIFMSIDENEVHSLRKVADEVFWENNFVDCIVWDKKASAKWVPPKSMMVNVHEYILAYKKTGIFKFIWEKRSAEKDGFKNPDNDPRWPWRESNIKSTIKPIEDAFSIYDPNTWKEYHNTRAFSKESIKKMIAEERILRKDTLPKQKEFMNEMTNENKAIKSSWGVFDAQSTTVFLKKLSPEVQFQNPKPIKLMNYLMKVSSSKDDLIVDFFSWSATTAHAVMELNAEDGWNRRHIQVQLPEDIEEWSEAYKAGYRYITDIWKERIRRAGQKILEDHAEQLAERETPLDIWFRVYRVDSTNMKDVYYTPGEIDQKNIWMFETNIKEDRRPQDLLTQVMIDTWVTLDLSIQTKTFAWQEVFLVGSNALVACFDEKIDISAIQEAVTYTKQTHDLYPLKIVLRDSSFARDDEMHNLTARLATTYGISEKEIKNEVLRVL